MKGSLVPPLLRLVTSAAVAVACMNVALPHAHAISINWVTVRDPGNAGQTKTYAEGGTLTVGAVAYSYQIMKYEFTNSQYVEFLNAIDPAGTNPQNVYSFNMGSNARGGINFTSGNPAGTKYAAKANMGDKPVNYVDWWDVARVANWLHNGAQTSGSTNSSASAPQNTGAYSVGTSISGTAPAKNPGALFSIPTENGWYKASYYNSTLNSSAGGYRLYGNSFDTAPGVASANLIGNGSAGAAGNFANYNNGADWNGQDGNVTTVGTNGGASYYGAFDMSGNLREWNDLTGAAGASRGLRGGDLSDSAFFCSSGNREIQNTDFSGPFSGFRLVNPVPEPASVGMVFGGGACCCGWLVFKRRHRA